MLKLGLTSGTVKIEEYNPEWKDEFLKEEALLKKQLQDYDVDIQHVGSTSIVGCYAKPIIDIAIGVETLEYGEELISALNIRKLKPVSGKSTTNTNLFDSKLTVGNIVIHERFGKGQILSLEGIGADKKAEIKFEVGGIKKLLLRFAKLDIIG